MWKVEKDPKYTQNNQAWTIYKTNEIKTDKENKIVKTDSVDIIPLDNIIPVSFPQFKKSIVCIKSECLIDRTRRI